MRPEPITRPRDLDAWRVEHAEYLRTPQWRRLRAAVIRRAGGICEGCLQRRTTLVHHETYKRWRREMAFDLRAVCDVCHDAIHGAPR